VSKYGNTKTTIDNITFDSKAEAARYLQLRQLQQAGEIRSLVVHPTYTVLEAFVDNEGVKQTAVRYTPDFSYIEGEQFVAEDVKGYPYRDFSMRAKLFKRAYPEVKLRIIKV
jgi:hypothetical protein